MAERTRSRTGCDLDIYARMVAARVRSDWQYRTSFVMLMLTQAAFVGLEFVALVIIVGLVPALGGWDPNQVYLLYGLSALAFGLTDVVFSPTDRLSRYVQEGSFDRLLLRPVPALIQLLSLEFERRRTGKAIPPLIVLIVAMVRIDVSWSPGRILTLLMALACGTVIYACLWVLAGSTSFWLVASQEATNAITYGGQFANEYPLHLYRPWIRMTLGWVVPLAFVAYVPTQHLTGAANPLGLPGWLVWTSPLVAAAVTAVTVLVWRLGIAHYQSTGS